VGGCLLGDVRASAWKEEAGVPTGIALRDAREQLFSAAERVLLRDGPGALTSRAVTAEAGVAKGVLHRHFADFDAFLAELVLDRIAMLDGQAAALRESAGTGTVAGNLARALTDLFSSVAVGVLALITFRDDVRARLRLRQAEGAAGVPLLTEAVAMIASYLGAEQELGRVPASVDIDTLAPMLIGTGHLLFADRESGPPTAAHLERVITSVVPGVVRERPAQEVAK
jgi:AcrR family transcriptional regulator